MVAKKTKSKSYENNSVVPITSSPSPFSHARNAPLDSLMDRFWDRNLFSQRPFERMGLMDRDAKKMFIQPRSDFFENEKEVRLTLDVPGVDRKDIQLNITPAGIEVRAEKRDEKEEKSSDTYHMERSYSGFFRTFPFSSAVDASKARAKYENGVLKMVVPKSSKLMSRGRSIKVD